MNASLAPQSSWAASASPPDAGSRRERALAACRGGDLSLATPLLREEVDAVGWQWIDDQVAEWMLERDLTAAGRLAEVSARLRWGGGQTSVPAPAPVPNRRVTVAKLAHDAEQLRYLRSVGVGHASLVAVAEAYDALAARLRAGGALGPDDQALLGAWYNRLVHLRETPRLPRALSSRWRPDRVEQQYLERPPGIVVIDDFLEPSALSELRAFCLESTVWFANRYAHGRLGAFFRDGFGCPLLLQVAEELRAALPKVLGDRHPLRQLWGFKNDATLPADANTHADFAAVNVNFWITPESANRDPESGGLVIYEVDAPPEWDFHTYNGDPELIHDYLRRQRARRIRVPYRANRAVIFNSDLFHGTEGVSFSPEYADRRVNITMLYGHRETDGHHAAHRPLSGQTPSWRSAAFRRAR